MRKGFGAFVRALTTLGACCLANRLNTLPLTPLLIVPCSPTLQVLFRADTISISLFKPAKGMR